MTDPITGKLSSKVIDSAAGASEKAGGIQGRGESPFKDMLEQMEVGKEFAEALGIDTGSLGLSGAPLNAISAEGIAVDPSGLTVGIERPDGAQKIIDMLSEVNKGQMQMDALVNEILYSGKRFTNQELLAIQAHVFHFAQMTELTVKVAEQGVSSVKTVLNTQIQ